MLKKQLKKLAVKFRKLKRSNLAQDTTFGAISKMGELKSRLLFLLGALVIFRLGAHIPVPGIDPM